MFFDNKYSLYEKLFLFLKKYNLTLLFIINHFFISFFFEIIIIDFILELIIIFSIELTFARYSISWSFIFEIFSIWKVILYFSFK